MIKIMHTEDGRVVEMIETNHEMAAMNFLASVLPIEFNAIAHFANMKVSILEGKHSSGERCWVSGDQTVHTVKMTIEVTPGEEHTFGQLGEGFSV